MPQELIDIVKSYSNNAEENDHIFELFTKNTDSIHFLKEHRDYIEVNNLGFGERAFAYMWYLILLDIQSSGLNPLLLEIGVFKGQIISLWALISKQIKMQSKIFGITPLKGNPKSKYSIINFLKYKLSGRFRRDIDFGNFYEEMDYLKIIRLLFKQFDLEFEKITILAGYSNDLDVINFCSDKKFSVIYIDGDHSFDGVLKDIRNYAPLIETGGFLVMDDASCNLPGSKFWKGHQSVSDACSIIESFSFNNVLNVGHNRIYRKI
jgi:hypothetical protein